MKEITKENIEIWKKYNCNIDWRVLTCNIVKIFKWFFWGIYYKWEYVVDITWDKNEVLYSERRIKDLSIDKVLYETT